MKKTLTVWLFAPLLVSSTALAQADQGAGPGAPVPTPSPGSPPPGGGAATTPTSGGTGQPSLPSGSGGTSAGGATTAPGPGGGTVYMSPFGLPAPGTDVNSGLPSSSRPTTDANTPGDSFDLLPQTEGGTVHGTESGSAVLTGRSVSVPPTHTVKRGDTLWEICDQYFQNPWMWPKVWSYNPEVQNPHWIYPGDQIRLRVGGGPNTDLNAGAVTLGSGGFVNRRPLVPANTIFLRDRGYVDDDTKDTWGEVGGSPEDQMLLSTGDEVYLEIDKGHDVSLGQELTVFRPLRNVGRGDAKGQVVAILGTARIDKWDPDHRIARAKLTESLDVIERGAKVGPVGRRFDIVPPKTDEVDLWAQITASIYPHVIYGQNQIVFIDKGEKDGLEPGNRLFVVSKGDVWRQSLSQASEYAAARPNEDQGHGIEKTGARGHGNDKNYPDEVIGEIRILRVRDHTATCLVTSSSRELEPGNQVVSRKGY
jgi:LysM repeat protein